MLKASGPSTRRNLQCLAAFSKLEALDDVKLRRVRRTVTVDVGIVRQADVSTTSVSPPSWCSIDSPYGLDFGCAECGTVSKTRRTPGPLSLIRRTSFFPWTKKSGLTRPMTRNPGTPSGRQLEIGRASCRER